MSSYRSFRDLDWGLLAMALTICSIGVLQIYSTTHEFPVWENTWWKQVLYILLGVVLMWFIASVDYHTLLGQVPVMYITTVLLLLVVLVFSNYPLETPLLILTLLNPLNLGRVLLLLDLDVAALLGYTGAVFQRFLGTGLGLRVATAALLLWTGIPLWLGMRRFEEAGTSRPTLGPPRSERGRRALDVGVAAGRAYTFHFPGGLQPETRVAGPGRACRGACLRRAAPVFSTGRLGARAAVAGQGLFLAFDARRWLEQRLAAALCRAGG